MGLPSADEDVLRIVAPLLAQTLRTRALAKDLSDSRSAAITAIEDERRRLRRDLHDGLGPTLTGVAFSVDAARNHDRMSGLFAAVEVAAYRIVVEALTNVARHSEASMARVELVEAMRYACPCATTGRRRSGGSRAPDSPRCASAPSRSEARSLQRHAMVAAWSRQSSPCCRRPERRAGACRRRCR